MDSDSSSFIDTTYSVDIRIENYLRRRREQEERNRLLQEDERRKTYEDFLSTEDSNILRSFQGLHFYTFTHKKIKFGFNPSEVAEVSIRIKFICILKYTGSFWGLGRNTAPVNLKSRLGDLFYKGESVDDNNILNVINAVHSLFVEWSSEYEEFRRRKIEKYRNGEIDYFELDSEDEELYLTESEIEAIMKKRERIMMRVAGYKKMKKTKRKRKTMDEYSEFERGPFIELNSD